MPSAFPSQPRAEPSSFALPTTIAKPAPVQVVAPPVVAPPVATPQFVAPQRLARNDELPDFLDGRARNRRAVMVVVGIALLALLGTIAAAIASHYRPL